jgi:hypothetical protein
LSGVEVTQAGSLLDLGRLSAEHPPGWQHSGADLQGQQLAVLLQALGRAQPAASLAGPLDQLAVQQATIAELLQRLAQPNGGTMGPPPAAAAAFVPPSLAQLLQGPAASAGLAAVQPQLPLGAANCGGLLQQLLALSPLQLAALTLPPKAPILATGLHDLGHQASEQSVVLKPRLAEDGPSPDLAPLLEAKPAGAPEQPSAAPPPTTAILSMLAKLAAAAALRQPQLEPHARQQAEHAAQHAVAKLRAASAAVAQAQQTPVDGLAAASQLLLTLMGSTAPAAPRMADLRA